MTTLSASLSNVQHAQRAPKPRILERNTFRYTRTDGAEVTRLHNTDIVVKQGDRITLNSGGWKTMTTKDRINVYAAPYAVYSDRGVWYVQESDPEYRWRAKEGSHRVPFYDGIVLPDAFNEDERKGIKVVAEDAALRKQIKAYCKAVRDLDALPVPNAGDCWFCSMKTQDGQTLGDSAGDHDHLREHLKDKYVHGSLIVNAMRDAGYRDEGISFAFRGAFPRDSVVRAVSRYFKRKLGLA